MIVGPAVWSSMITEKHHTSMISFWGESKKVEERVIIEEEVVRIS